MKKLIILLLAGILFIPACCQAPKQEAPPPKPMPVAKAPTPDPCAASAMAKTGQAFPVGANAIRLEKMAPQQAQANAEFEYSIKVTNLTDRSLGNVVVKDMIPAGITFKTSSPKMATMDKNVAVWTIGDMSAKESMMINVTAISRTTGSFTTCADVTYDNPLCAKIVVVDAALHLTKKAPAESLKCDRIPLEYVVTNKGTGTACGITISETLSEGLVTSGGTKNIQFTIDSLAPGESKKFSKMVDAKRAGVYSGMANAAQRSGGSVTSNSTITNVTTPSLKITQVGPKEMILGRSMTFEITVQNTGNSIAKNTVCEIMVPEHVNFESATAGGTFSRSSPGKVKWNLGTIEKGASKTVMATLITGQPGLVITEASATAFCAEEVEASAITNVTGIPAILLEVIDVHDPVEIGENDTYVISVTNQGTKVDTNVQIMCELEPGMKYVSSSGPTNARVKGNKIAFEPLASLEPKEKVEWRVVIKALSDGDWRFKTSMTSNELTRPVTETEATRIFK